MLPRQLRSYAIACALVSAVFCVAPSSAEQARAPRPDLYRLNREQAKVAERYFAAAPADVAKQDPSRLMQSLEQLLKGYQEENATLRARVKELESQVEALKQSKGVVVPQPGVPGQSQVPPSWKPFQFNGMTYYVVPLGDGEGAPVRRTTAPAAPAPSK